MELTAPLVASPDFAGCAPAEKRFICVDEKPLAERFATDKHPKAHLIAVGKGCFCVDRATTQLHLNMHHNAIFAVTGRTAHRPTVVHCTFDGRSIRIRLLPRLHLKTHPVAAVIANKLFDAIGVERRTMRAGIDLRLYPRNTNAGEGNPLTPAHNSV
ncbi:hypothetical protein FB472_0316 [Rhodoglobus vestalii]|uniref:Uncharacterized protein n=1 Tax=Rhodoglobus vestalii TaxID=193384 RepID=A0A8H2K2Z5_9MICO|nr:hypothetical protein FB472_0316 [Rhodoglobus vestalii]